MRVSKDELITVLSQFNPWWRSEPIADLPDWKRAAFRELFTWTTSPPAPRAVLLSGARQVGKTTLLMQAVDGLLAQGVPAANICWRRVKTEPLRRLNNEPGVEAELVRVGCG